MQYATAASGNPRPSLSKVGLYTSPHLRFVRERIQINNEPLSEDVFAKYFFEVWDTFEEAANTRSRPSDASAKPVYFRFLTLMAFHTYVREGVDTAIIECGIGGEYDSTNIITKPIVAGITSLGIDHTAMLGNTIEEIAWHKGGIIKPTVPCYTVPQPPTAQSVLENRARDVNAPITIVERNPQLQNIKLGLTADFQHINASLAIAIAWHHLFLIPYKSSYSLPPQFIQGLEQVRWPGRCEIRHERKISWYIDSGHTLESIELAGQWFASQISNNEPPPLSSQSKRMDRRLTRILLFNQQTRDANALAKALHTTLSRTSVNDNDNEQPFSHAVFCTNITSKSAGYKPDLVSMNANKQDVDKLSVQKGLAETWRGICGEGKGEVVVKGSIEEAVEWCRDVALEMTDGREVMEEDKVKVLVTGSVHLVGGFLEVLAMGEDES